MIEKYLDEPYEAHVRQIKYPEQNPQEKCPLGQYPQWMIPQTMPPQGMPPLGMPPLGMPPQGMPPQGISPQGMPPLGMTPQGHTMPHPYEEGYLAPYTPGYHHYGQNAPTMRPPGFIPRKPIHHPASIRICLNKFTYIWLTDGRNFWAWIPYISRHTIYGYRWNGRRWIYFEADVNQIDSFWCVR